MEEDFLPEEDKGRMFCLVIAPEGSTAAYTDRMVKQMEVITAEQPEVAGFFSATALGLNGPGNPAQGLMFVRLKEDRDRSVQDMMAGPTGMGARFFSEVEGALSFPVIPKAVSRSFGQPYQLVLEHQDLDELDAFAQSFSQTLREAGFVTGVRSGFALDKPELEIRVNRDRAAAAGVAVEDVARTLQVMFSGADVSRLKLEQEYDGRSAGRRRATRRSLEWLNVRAYGKLVRLGIL